MRRALVIVTGSYPYASSAEASFLSPELEVLTKSFDRCILLPRSLLGEHTSPPAGVVVDEDFGRENSSSVRRRRLAEGLRHATPLLPELEPLRRFPSVLSARRLGYGLGYAGWVRAALRAFFERQRLDPADTVLLTYWLDEFTAGALLARSDLPRLVVASRAHGLDVYEERHVPPFIAFRPWTLRRIDLVMSVSERGRAYLARRYPQWSARYTTARLGVRRPAASGRPSSDGVVRVVTCSSLIPLKRVPLIARAVIELAYRVRVEWTHFGDGPELAAVRTIVAAAPPGLVAQLRGAVENEVVLDHYARAPVDCFVNASTTEGVPVSVMEAISFGIPIVATDVGGNAELVSNENGRLVAPDTTPADLADAIASAAGAGATVRDGSLRVFDDRIDAAKVHRRTATLLTEL